MCGDKNCEEELKEFAGVKKDTKGVLKRAWKWFAFHFRSLI